MSPGTTGGRSAGIAAVAVLGFLLGALTFVGAVGRLASPRGTLLGTVVGVGLFVLSLSLLPTAVLLVRRDRRGQYLGIVAFAGVAVLNVLPAALGTGGVPLLGVALATACVLYLSLASEEFDSGAQRAVPDEEDDDGPARNPLR